MAKKIVLGCSLVPGVGGANTATYKLFELMQKDGWDIAYVNVISEDDPDYFHYVFGERYGNPKGFANVHNCILRRPMFYPTPRHDEVVDLLRTLQAEVHIGADFGAALLMKHAAPETPSVFFTTGCNQVREFLTRKKTSTVIALEAYLRARKDPPPVIHLREREAVTTSDLVVTNSEMVKRLYQRFFPEHAGKILSDAIWLAEWIYLDALEYAHFKKPFVDREIDVLFVTNDWTRIEKNFKLVKELLVKSNGLRMHVAGDVDRESRNAVFHGFMPDRAQLFMLMGNAKTVASPSTFDSAPGILFEASTMGCNVVASKNCGNWRLCHPRLLVDPFDVGMFCEKLMLSVTKKFDDNIDFFLKTQSYRKFMDTIEVFPNHGSWDSNRTNPG